MATAEDNLSRNDAAAAAGLYRLLARLWLREVDEPLLRSLTGSPLREPFLRAGGELPETVSPEVLQALSVDYCRLFLGPTDHLPPVQSVWQQGQFQGQAVRSMAGWIELTGYDTRLVP